MKIATTALLLSATSALAIGYENKGGWKKGEDGSIETDGDGNPIYIDADGKESPLAPGYINRLNTEAAQHRTAAKEANDKLKAFGDMDPKEARAALDKVKDTDFDDLVNKGEIEAVRKAVTDAMQADLDKTETELADTRSKLQRVTLDNAFNSSEFLKNRLAVPQDAVRATFRDRFKVEDDKVIPLDNNGEPLRNKNGDVANVDEAFEAIISARSDADNWIKAPEVGGSGSQGGGGNGGTGNKMKRAEFDALDPGKKGEVGQKAAKGEIEIVD